MAAAKHFEKHLAKDSNNIGIYVGTKLMGCSGLAYDIDFVTQQPADTTVVDQQGLRFLYRINL